MDTPPTLFKPPNTPAMPLFPVSPERVNKLQSPSSPSRLASAMSAITNSFFTIDTSKAGISSAAIEFGKPSMGESSANSSPVSPVRAPCHSRANSDARVGGLVAQFESFDIRDRSEEQRALESRYRRAQMGREVAETEAKEARAAKKRLQEELEQLRREKESIQQQLNGYEDGLEARVRAFRGEHERALESYRHNCSKLVKQADQARFAAESSLDEVKIRYKRSHDRREILKREIESLRKEIESNRDETFKAKYQREELQATAQKAFDRVATLETEHEILKMQLKEDEIARMELESRLKVVESERDTLKTSLQEEEVARIAAEGRLALPGGEDDEFDSPKKTTAKARGKRATRYSDKENLMPVQTEEIHSLQQELDEERLLRKRAEQMRMRAQEQIEFMKMECQFECCSCRIAEQTSSRYVHDLSVTIPTEQARQTTVEPTLSPDSGVGDEMEDILSETFQPESASTPPRPTTSGTDAEPGADLDAEVGMGTVISFSPTTGTFRSVPSPVKAAAVVQDDEPELDTEAMKADMSYHTAIESDLQDDSPSNPQEPSAEAEEEEPVPIAADLLPPATPVHREIRTVTTTTTIPIHFSPYTPSANPPTPSTVAQLQTYRSAEDIENWPAPDTIDKRAALEKIRERRNRARSVTMGLATPRRQMVAGIGRRDISAPASAREWTGERK